MKNIHILPTDKPSKLIKLSNGELRYNENMYKIIIPKEEPKEETLEDFLYQYWFDSPTFDDKDKETFIDGGLIGAKWQQGQDKKMYSEAEVDHCLSDPFLLVLN